MSKVYEIIVEETVAVTYTVVADDPQQASDKFNAWANEHTETICSDLLKSDGNGWEYSEPFELYADPKYADIK